MKKKSIIIAVAGVVAVLCVGCLALTLLTDTRPAPETTATTVAEVTEPPPPPPTEAQPSATSTETPLPTDTPQPPPTDTPAPSGHAQAQVISIIDGDTIEVSIEGQTFTIRYIGIDTPETRHPDKPVEPFGPEATAKNEEFVGGKIVGLEKDVSETDRYGRLLRYVYVGDLMVNAELVRLGYAQVSTYPPDVKYQDIFLLLQQEAREAERGLWSIPPEPAPPPTQLPIVECPYIGNRNSKKFHHYWCSGVGDMKEENKVCLQSREEAIAGGYVPCKRCDP